MYRRKYTDRQVPGKKDGIGGGKKEQEIQVDKEKTKKDKDNRKSCKDKGVVFSIL